MAGVRGRADLLGRLSAPLPSNAVPHLRDQEAERRDPVVHAERADGEVLPQEDPLSGCERLDPGAVPHAALELLVDRDDLREARDRRRLGADDAARDPTQAALRGPVREPGGVVEVGVRQEDVRDRDQLGRGAPEVEGQVERRKPEPRLPARHRHARDGETGQRHVHAGLAVCVSHRREITSPDLYFSFESQNERSTRPWCSSTIPHAS